MPPPPPKRHAATRIPQASDFEHLKPSASSPSGQARGLHVSLVYPHDVPETTTSIMVLLHGFGDSDVAFAQLARSLNLPGVLGIAVRGVEPLPPALLGLDPAGSQEEEEVGGGGGGGGGGVKHWHWGDDVSIDPATGGMDLDPGFGKAQKLVLDGLVLDTLVGRLGWRTEDILLFGFGQGGSLALGMASRLRDGGEGGRVVDVTESDGAGGGGGGQDGGAFKGVVSIGGPLPPSMVPTLSARQKARTPVLVCRGRNSQAVDDDALEYIRSEVRDVREVTWSKRSGGGGGDDGMPRNRDEMLPIMQFLAERLASDQWS